MSDDGDPIDREAMLEALSDDDVSFSFFQAVRLLQRLHPDRDRVGHIGQLSSEVVRFGVNPSLAFPAGEIQSLDPSAEGPWKMSVNFLGLVGHMGVLPHHYTELVLDANHSENAALAAFLDLFHHRLISLFYRAWEEAHFYAVHERSAEDGVTKRLYDLIGLGGDAIRGVLGMNPEALLFHVGLLGPRRRSAVGLEQLLEDFFGVPVAVEQFVGSWNAIDGQNLCALDEDQSGPQVSLGGGAVVGDELWDPQARARLVIGPLTRAEYQELLPAGRGYPVLKELVRFFSEDEVEYEVRLILSGGDVPGVVLGGDDESTLGWSAWLRSEPSDAEGDDTVLML